MSVLEINNLHTRIERDGQVVRAVDGISFSIERGQTFALLGESGCGKSMTALSILRLLPQSGRIAQGEVKLEGRDLLELTESAMREVRGSQVGIIFQEPGLSLNPVLTIGSQISEVLQRHAKLSGSARRAQVIELLSQVGIPDSGSRVDAYPFQLSGGMKQRVMIAMALAAQPALLIADEPTTALDVTIQAQILDLLGNLQRSLEMSMLLITHDLGVVSKMANRVAVMYAGHLVETASRDAFFSRPAHPYSQKLFASLPGQQKRGSQLEAIGGAVPSLASEFRGCRFAPRCDYAWVLCHDAAPGWFDSDSGSKVRCHLYSEAGRERSRERKSPDQAPDAIDGVKRDRVLDVSGLKVHFPIRRGPLQRVVGHVAAVDGVDLAIDAGRTLALVGESGCGKTTVGKAILQLLRPSSGSVNYLGTELAGLSGKELIARRRGLQIIFQDPFASLNPRMRIREIIEEGMLAIGSKPAPGEIEKLLDEVGLAADAQYRYPHEFSGGQRQRIAIARALAVNPRLLICDEPTSALDVSVQAQILNLLKKLQHEMGLSYLFITHNISVVEYLAHEVAVMYLGRIVESGSVEAVLARPAHPYTRALLAAVPKVEAVRSDLPQPIAAGDLPSPMAPPGGCHYRLRCPQADEICRQRYPEPVAIGARHRVSCHHYSR